MERGFYAETNTNSKSVNGRFAPSLHPPGEAPMWSVAATTATTMMMLVMEGEGGRRREMIWYGNGGLRPWILEASHSSNYINIGFKVWRTA